MLDQGVRRGPEAAQSHIREPGLPRHRATLMEKPLTLIQFLVCMFPRPLMFSATQWPRCLWELSFGLNLSRKAHCPNLNLGRPDTHTNWFRDGCLNQGERRKHSPFPPMRSHRCELLSSSCSQAEREVGGEKANTEEAGQRAREKTRAVDISLQLSQMQTSKVFSCSVQPIFHPSEPKVF